MSASRTVHLAWILAGWLISIGTIVAVALWLHRHPEILVDVNQRLPAKDIVNARIAYQEGRYDDVIRLAPKGIDFYMNLYNRPVSDDREDQENVKNPSEQVGKQRWGSQAAQGHAYLAMAYLQRHREGDWEKAVKHFQAVADLMPNLNAGRYLYEYGKLLNEMGKREDAERLLVEALQRGDGGWVPEIQSLRARMAAEEKRSDTLPVCLYDVARYTRRPLPVPLPVEILSATSVQAAYLASAYVVEATVPVPDEVRAQLETSARRYLEQEPNDMTTRLVLASHGLAEFPEIASPLELPMDYNFLPPGENDALRRNFGVPGGTLFDVMVTSAMGRAQLALELSVDFVPPNPVQLLVLYDDRDVQTFDLNRAEPVAYTIKEPLREGRHIVAIRISGETYDLEYEPVIRLHRISLSFSGRPE